MSVKEALKPVERESFGIPAAVRPLSAKRRFAIEPLEDRIAPQGSLLDLTLNLTIDRVSVTIDHVNVIVSGNVIQVALLGGTQSGTVMSAVTAT